MCNTTVLPTQYLQESINKMHASNLQLDNALHQEFHNFTSQQQLNSNNNKIAIKIQINQEKFIYSDLISIDINNSHSNTIETVLHTIKNDIINTNTVPCYVIFRIADQSIYQLISYIPDNNVTVRDRMLYASSMQSLRNVLNCNLLNNNVWHIKDIDELNSDEFNTLNNGNNNVNQQQQHNDVNNDSVVQHSVSNTSAMASVGVHSNDSITSVLQQFHNNSVNTVIFKLNEPDEVLTIDYTSSNSNSTFNDIATHVTANEPRYILHSISRQVMFIYYCPDNIKPKNKMMYSACKGSVVKLLDHNNIKIDRSVELSSIDELRDITNEIENIKPTTQQQQQHSTTAKFTTRPKRAGNKAGGARLISQTTMTQ